MKMIVGLGNPGRAYEKTRHNFGFMVLDRIAEIQENKFSIVPKHSSEILITEINSTKVILVKPQTFMNNSGEAVKNVSDYYKIKPTDILLVYDDIDLGFGEIKTTGKSSAGHKGVESVFGSISTNDISRVRLGISNNSDIPTENFVTQDFLESEKEILPTILDRAIKEVTLWLEIN